MCFHVLLLPFAKKMTQTKTGNTQYKDVLNYQKTTWSYIILLPWKKCTIPKLGQLGLKHFAI